MGAVYALAIIGSGPAGMSAAARAAKRGLSHVLLERSPHLTDTVFSFHKRKHVMATPEFLPLRSDLDFKEGRREEIIESWERDMEDARVEIRYNTEVVSLTGQRGAFAIALADGDTLLAEQVILAIGVQANPRRLAVPGADLPFVQYQLDDPDEYRGEAIAVIGGGDAAIENALALADGNQVTIVNRGSDFARAKPANAARLRSAVNRGAVRELAKARPKRVGVGYLALETAAGDLRLSCDRIIARIGTEARPEWLEGSGVVFQGDGSDALPQLSGTYESSVPGLYIIGAMAGFPLIKHCLKQGYEVVEHILGNPIQPLDEPLLQGKLARAGLAITVDQLVATVQQRLQLYARLTLQQVREFLVHSEIRLAREGEIIFRQNHYTNSLYSILVGEVALAIDPANPREILTLKSGDFFGEMELISGRRRAATATARVSSLLLEIERNAIVRLVRSAPAVRREIDAAAIIRHIKAYLAPNLPDASLADIVRTAELAKFAPNDVLIREGGRNDNLYLIRKGSVTVSRQVDGRDVIIDYLPAGKCVGEQAMLQKSPPRSTIKAASATEAIKIDGAAMRALLATFPDLRRETEDRLALRLREQQRHQPDARASGRVEFLLRQGAGEATNLLLIDQTLCVHCDNCEKACAATHDGVSRLEREAGPTYEAMHLAVACRHCEHPACMSDCPTDSIKRMPDGEVLIDDNCSGCGNCERNCPYGVVQMSALPPPRKSNLLMWLLFGRGDEPGEDKSPEAMGKRTGRAHAVKCDLCTGVDGGPACVRACPTGAAIRVNPEDYISAALRGGCA